MPMAEHLNVCNELVSVLPSSERQIGKPSVP